MDIDRQTNNFTFEPHEVEIIAADRVPLKMAGVFMVMLGDLQRAAYDMPLLDANDMIARPRVLDRQHRIATIDSMMNFISEEVGNQMAREAGSILGQE